MVSWNGSPLSLILDCTNCCLFISYLPICVINSCISARLLLSGVITNSVSSCLSFCILLIHMLFAPMPCSNTYGGCSPVVFHIILYLLQAPTVSRRLPRDWSTLSYTLFVCDGQCVAYSFKLAHDINHTLGYRGTLFLKDSGWKDSSSLSHMLWQAGRSIFPAWPTNSRSWPPHGSFFM